MSPAVAAVIAAGVAAAGWRARWLTGTGAAVAAGIGAAVLTGGGLVGLALLGTFFVSGSALSLRAGDRPRRSAAQVGANGWTAAVGGLLILCHLPALGWAVLSGGLAAAQADTWATEIGRRSQRAPVLITTGQSVATGTSGGISWLGTLGGALGAATIAAVSTAAGVGAPHAGWILAAGTIGMFADSLLGATLQVRARCDGCGATVESRRHCDQTATPIRGLHWMNNDMVNAIGSGIGAAIGALAVLA